MVASVVMAVYNGGRYLRESVQSVLGQTFRDFEFIIINDGSEDDSRSLLDHYAQRDQRLRLHHQDHRGLIVSLNAGCRLAQGEYIARLDADDVAFPDRLQVQIEFLKRNPHVALVGGAYVLIDENGTPSIRLRKPLGHEQITAMMRRAHNPFLHSTIVMRTQAFRSLSGYKSAFPHAEDYDLWLRFAERYKVANVPEPVIFYRVHRDQVSLHNLEQGVMSVLGSQAAARIRGETGSEATWQMGRVTRELLHELGVRDRTIQKALTEAYFWQGNLMLLSGHGAAGLPLFREALSHSRVTWLRRKIGHWFCRVYAKAHRDQPRPARRMLLGVLLGLTACSIDLGLTRHLVWFKICRLSQWLWGYRLNAPVLERSKG